MSSSCPSFSALDLGDRASLDDDRDPERSADAEAVDLSPAMRARMVLGSVSSPSARRPARTRNRSLRMDEGEEDEDEPEAPDASAVRSSIETSWMLTRT